MLIDVQGYVKRLLNIGNRADDVKIDAIARPAGHRQSVGFRKADHRIVVVLGWAKSGGEFLYREELAVGRAGRIVELVEKLF